MYEIERQNMEKIVLKPEPRKRLLLWYILGCTVYIYILAIEQKRSIIDMIGFTLIIVFMILPMGLSANKTITLDKFGIVIEWWFMRKQYDWNLVKIWEIECVNPNTGLKRTSYKKAIVIAPLWMTPPKLLKIETIEAFFKPLTFAVIRYKPESFRSGEAKLYHYDKELLLQKLAEWGAINIEDWRKRYPN